MYPRSKQVQTPVFLLRSLLNEYPCEWYEHTGHWLECSPMARETWLQLKVESYQRLKKWYLMLTLFNAQRYKVRIKGKVEKSKERSSAFPYTLV